MTGGDADAHAAGGLLRREAATGPQFCVVHRPRYQDWTIPKGKLEAGESHRHAAVREIEEETGLGCSVGPELPSTRYLDHEGRTKMVRYWLMTPTTGDFEGNFEPNAEVDELRWLPPAEARELLTYEHDRGVLAAALGFDAPIFLIRHAKAGSRAAWEEDDRLRPLSSGGRGQAEALAGLLAPEGVGRILSSPFVRCVQTVRPLALALGLPVLEREDLAEGGDADACWAWMAELGDAVAVCSHGDVIPALIERAERDGADLPATRECRKGSVWRLERRAGRVVAATYLPAG